MAEHLHDEDLSDLVDGGDPTDAESHLAGCDRCRGRLDAMRAAAQAVAAPPPPPSPAAREAAVAGAMTRAVAPTRRVPAVPAWLAAAAVVVVLLAAGGVLLAGRDGDQGTTALDEAATGGGAAAGSTGTGFIDGGDLGAQSDPASLHTALASALGIRNSAETDDATSPFASGTDNAVEAAPSQAAPQAARPSGKQAPLVCIAEAQAAGSGRLGPLVYGARLRWQGQAAVVLVFASSGQQQLTQRAFVMAREGCQLLVAQSF